MPTLNHFSISAALGSTLGPSVAAAHGQLGSSELAATLSALIERRKGFVDDLEAHEGGSRVYEKGVKRAFMLVRDGFSPDRVIADPELDRKFLKACRDNGIDDSAFHLNLTLLSLRKNNKLVGVGRSRRATVPDQWRYSVASEVAARAMYYRYGLSVDSTLCHPVLVKEFDRLAEEIAPGFTPFEYRWAALNIRKKGSAATASRDVVQNLQWSRAVRFDVSARLPTEKGIFVLHEGDTHLFVAGTENIRESIVTQQRITRVSFFDPDLWHPDPSRLHWKYVAMPDTVVSDRYEVVNSLVGEWRPVFNIPRGDKKRAA
jgi:hypothetical protein